jgi:hypothetical protein
MWLFRDRLDKSLETLRNTPDRSPELFRYLMGQSNRQLTGSLTLLTKIQKIERRLNKLEEVKETTP